MIEDLECYEIELENEMETFCMQLNMQNFISEDEIEYGKDLLCLVSFYDELPEFVILQRKEDGIRMSFNNSKLENMRILKWAYLPDTLEEFGIDD